MESIKSFLGRRTQHRHLHTPIKSSNTPLHPFKAKIVGSMKIEGLVKQEWVKEIIKKISLIIACQISTSKSDWGMTAPHLFVALRQLFYNNLVFQSFKDTTTTRRLYTNIEEKFISLLSYIPDVCLPESIRVIHRWEFESPSKIQIVITYDLECGIELYDYTKYDDLLVSGYKPFPSIDIEHESVCNQLISRCSERPINPDLALSVLIPDTGRLKKLLHLRTSTNNILGRDQCCGLVPSAPRLSLY